MSDALPTYVLENYAKAVNIDLGSWLLKNPLPSIVEPKYDGIRVFLFKSGDDLVISSKQGGVYTPRANPKVFAKIPEFMHAPHRMILDGEYVSREAELHLFDVLVVDDRDLRTNILDERKKVLHEILRGTSLEVEFHRASTVETITQLKEEFVSKNGLEGAVVKNPLSRYGDPASWLKLKRYDTIDCFVMGYEETPEMKRTGSARSWFVGVYKGEEIIGLGKVGSFVESIDPRRVRIGSVVEVRFQEVTEDLKLRAPFIIKIRHDKTPKECLFSQLKQSETKKTHAGFGD